MPSDTTAPLGDVVPPLVTVGLGRDAAHPNAAIAATPIIAGMVQLRVLRAVTTLGVSGADGCASPPKLVPQFAQNIAPGGATMPHCRHADSAIAVPQLSQNLPWTDAPHWGQDVEDEWCNGPPPHQLIDLNHSRGTLKFGPQSASRTSVQRMHTDSDTRGLLPP